MRREAPKLEPKREILTPENAVREFVDFHTPVCTIWKQGGVIDKDSKMHAVIDEEAQTKLIEEAFMRGKGIVVAGSSGDGGESFFEQEHLVTLVRLAVDVRKRLGRFAPITFGTYGHTAEEAINNAKAAFAAGGDIALAPGHFFKNPDGKGYAGKIDDPVAMQEHALNYYKEFAQGIGHDRSWALYNIPKVCLGQFAISPELLLKVFTECPNAIGIKDSSTKMKYAQAYTLVARYYEQITKKHRNMALGFVPTAGGLLYQPLSAADFLEEGIVLPPEVASMSIDPELVNSGFFDADTGIPIETNFFELMNEVLLIAKKERNYGVVATVQGLTQGFLDRVVGGREKKGFSELTRGMGQALKLMEYGSACRPLDRPTLDDLEILQNISEAVEEHRDEEKLLKSAGISEDYIKAARANIDERRELAKKAKR